jgi:hypothetical protein
MDPGLGDPALNLMQRNMRADLVAAEKCLS